LVQEFDAMQAKVETADVLLKRVQSFTYVASLAFHKDLLTKVNHLSACFQSDHFEWETGVQLIKATLHGVEVCYVNPAVPGGTFLKSIMKAVPEFGDDPEEVMQFTYPHTFKGDTNEYTLYVTHEEYAHTIEMIKLCGATFCSELRDRFPSVPLLEAFSVFSPSNFKFANDEILGYGDDQLEFLANHFSGAPVMSCTATHEKTLCPLLVAQQWETIKYSWKSEENGLFASFDTYWDSFLNDPEKVRQYAQLLFLVKVRKVLPLATACCERGFSTMAMVKTEEKSRMSTDILSARMMVYLNGPLVRDKTAVQSLVLETYKRWTSMKKRRPKKSHKAARPGARKARDERNIVAVLSGAYDVSEDDEESDGVGEGDGEGSKSDEESEDSDGDTAEEHDAGPFECPDGVYHVPIANMHTLAPQNRPIYALPLVLKTAT
jgi:hypothetical protein